MVYLFFSYVDRVAVLPALNYMERNSVLYSNLMGCRFGVLGEHRNFCWNINVRGDFIMQLVNECFLLGLNHLWNVKLSC